MWQGWSPAPSRPLRRWTRSLSTTSRACSTNDSTPSSPTAPAAAGPATTPSSEAPSPPSADSCPRMVLPALPLETKLRGQLPRADDVPRSQPPPTGRSARRAPPRSAAQRRRRRAREPRRPEPQGRWTRAMPAAAPAAQRRAPMSPSPAATQANPARGFAQTTRGTARPAAVRAAWGPNRTSPPARPWRRRTRARLPRRPAPAGARPPRERRRCVPCGRLRISGPLQSTRRGSSGRPAAVKRLTAAA